jgi:hypothetical protein
MAIDSLFFDAGKRYYRHAMEPSKRRYVGPNPESSTTTANATTTEDLEMASILAGLSSGMSL